eukprot:TRINITY_DN5283_c0_g2_i1.p1 TRINITY_DN5283_c0_g2~~TRINITY_DN5283_c0_g2_i1.p1  ORF type:complete len:346 (+),score=63.55 TRINITY_DN5283_c0_g2_i1:14-1051(+)
MSIAVEKHERYLKFCVNMLPNQLVGQDCNRVVISYFALTSLDILGLLDKYFDQDRKNAVIEYLYALQVVPPTDHESHPNCGFRGSTFFGTPYDPNHEHIDCVHSLDYSHVTMTAMSLLLLVVFGDDLSRVNKPAILSGLKACQREDGSFGYLPVPTETDMRFIYSACVSCYIMNDWTGIDTDKIVEYILNSQRYDYAFAQEPGCESHASACYLAIATLTLLGRLDELNHKEELVEWLIQLQGLGFCGRPNKLEDTCYSFWVGGALELLGHYDVVQTKHLEGYILSTEGDNGGFSKWSNTRCDPYHTHHGLCGLSLLGNESVEPVHPALGVTMRIANRIQELHTAN